MKILVTGRDNINDYYDINLKHGRVNILGMSVWKN